MKEIPLTQGQIALVDDEDFERVNAFKWCARWHSRTKSFYAVRNELLLEYSGRSRQTIYMSRFIKQTPKGLICDHMSHNTLDNQKSNLRNCTVGLNNINTRLRTDNKTGFRGVMKFKDRYKVILWSGGKRVLQKYFVSLEEAIAARNEAIKKYHGEFANIE